MIVPKKFSGFWKFGVTPGGGVRAGVFDRSSFDKSIIYSFVEKSRRLFCWVVFQCHKHLERRKIVWRILFETKGMIAHREVAHQVRWTHRNSARVDPAHWELHRTRSRTGVKGEIFGNAGDGRKDCMRWRSSLAHTSRELKEGGDCDLILADELRISSLPATSR